jgi:hypothetical protein
MANVNAPFGFNPVRYLSGQPYNGACNVYSVASGYGTAIYIGDPVVDIGTSTSWADGTVTKDVQLAATTDVITGIVIGVIPDTRDSTIYRAASTSRRLLVADDPNLLFEIQEGTGGTALTAADLGLNVSFAAGTPSTVTGKSGATVDNSTEADHQHARSEALQRFEQAQQRNRRFLHLARSPQPSPLRRPARWRVTRRNHDNGWRNHHWQ